MSTHTSVTEPLIGTSGYSYDDWVGIVYPEGTPKRDFLSLYARRFPFTELNFSYYRMPRPQLLEGMLTRTPDSFRFSVKAHGSLTHERSGDWQNNARSFRDAVAGLHEQGRLLAVLLQFPYSFHYTVSNRKYLGALTRELGSLPLAVEFRNTEWFHDAVYEEMAERRLSLVLPDLPELQGLPALGDAAKAGEPGASRDAAAGGMPGSQGNSAEAPDPDEPRTRENPAGDGPEAPDAKEPRVRQETPGQTPDGRHGGDLHEAPTPLVVTGPLAYVRMHGRNRESWWSGDNVTRYDYSYSDEELREWIPALRDLAGQAEQVVVAFNNHARAQAVLNAERLRELIFEDA